MMLAKLTVTRSHGLNVLRREEKAHFGLALLAPLRERWAPSQRRPMGAF
jgi:hypothetical protein